MNGIEKSEIQVIGIDLETKTSNQNGKAHIDCGHLWHKFMSDNIIGKIPNTVSHNIYAVYYNYEGDYTEPYSFMIGCEVTHGTEAPEGMKKITIPKNSYRTFTAKGKIPDAVADVWHLIWGTKMDRDYSYDFEVYGEKSQDIENAEVEVFVGMK